MEKIYFLLVALLLSQNLLAIDRTWTGSINTDWATASNWSPSGMPTADDAVFIPDVANKPVILSGITAVCIHVVIQEYGALTVSSGGSLIVQNTSKSKKIGICILANSILTNTGTLVINTTGYDISIPNGNGNFTNTASGIVNFQSGRGINCFAGFTGSVINNQGIMNYSANDFFLSLESGNTFNNSGIINIIKGYGISVGGGTMNNQACGKLLMPNCDFINSAAGSLTINAGLIVSNALPSTSGSFNNKGVLKYNAITGVVNTTGDGVVIANNTSTPIFSNGSTINGIYTDSTAITPAGTFIAPSTFVPSGTLPKSLQTLYIKIKPSNGACVFLVPFMYNGIEASLPFVETVAIEAELNQNYPNPFIYETKITFILPKTNKANLTIYDITGKQMFMLNKGFKMGYNEVILDKSSFQHTGTYFYRLTSDKYTAVKRLEFFAE